MDSHENYKFEKLVELDENIERVCDKIQKHHETCFTNEEKEKYGEVVLLIASEVEEPQQIDKKICESPEVNDEVEENIFSQSKPTCSDLPISNLKKCNISENPVHQNIKFGSNVVDYQLENIRDSPNSITMTSLKVSGNGENKDIQRLGEVRLEDFHKHAEIVRNPQNSFEGLEIKKPNNDNSKLFDIDSEQKCNMIQLPLKVAANKKNDCKNTIVNHKSKKTFQNFRRKCPTCKKWRSDDSFQNHCKSCKNEKKVFFCTFEGCNAFFEKKGGRDQHVTHVHQSQLVECSYESCKSLVKSQNLNQHIKAKHQKIKKRCSNCKIWVPFYSFTGHFDRCTSDGTKKFQCTHRGCRARFTTPGNRSTHMSVFHRSSAKISRKNVLQSIPKKKVEAGNLMKEKEKKKKQSVRKMRKKNQKIKKKILNDGKLRPKAIKKVSTL